MREKENKTFSELKNSGGVVMKDFQQNVNRA